MASSSSAPLNDKDKALYDYVKSLLMYNNSHMDAQFLTVVNNMVRQGANPERASVLHLAALGARTIIARALIEEHNCDVNKVDDKGMTPLICAISGSVMCKRITDYSVVRMLIAKGADTSSNIRNPDGKTLLQLYKEEVKLANIIRNDMSWPPASVEAEIVELLSSGK